MSLSVDMSTSDLTTIEVRDRELLGLNTKVIGDKQLGDSGETVAVA